MKWLSILKQAIRDLGLMGFGAWIIWKEVYVPDPNPYLIIVGFACMVPSARAAVSAILHDPGSSLPSSPNSEERQSSQSPQLSSRREDGNGRNEEDIG